MILTGLTPTSRNLLRTLVDLGFRFERRSKGSHVILRHPSGAMSTLPCRLNGSDQRAMANLLGQARRAIAEAEARSVAA